MRIPMAIMLAVVGCGAGGGSDTVVVGSKNFTESVLLGEIVAQQFERTGLDVDRRLNLSGSFIAHRALTTGQLDVYVEYTGTAYSAILNMEGETDAVRVFGIVDSVYRSRWDLQWTEPLGFNNTFAILVRASDAERLGLRTVTDAVPHAADWRFGAGYEFIERADGFRGLVDTYGLSFAGHPREMELGLIYRSLAEGRVDMVAGNSTDGQIENLNLVHLEDDRGYFPPYEAAPVVRSETLARYPRARDALRQLGGVLTEARMRVLNRYVDVDKRDVRDVATEFLDSLER